jgi:hypothetical protein
MKIEVEKAMELFRHHDKVKFILTGLGEREYETIEFKEVVDLLEKQIPKEAKPNKRIPGIGKCQICKTELCIDDEDLHYCPTCGQRLK